MKFWKNASKSDRTLFTWSVACLVLSLFILGMKAERVNATSADDEEFYRFMDVAAEVYSEIKGKYVEEVDSALVLESALSGMFSALDEHSQYMDPRMLESLNKDTGGEFSGIGIHITMRQGLLTVVAPIPGSPSARLGIMPWDRIIEIEGETTEGMNIQDAVDKLTGPSGTKVSIKVYREGEAEPLDFTITRATIKIDSVYHAMHDDDDKIGYIRIARFSENTASDLRNAMVELKSEGMKALIMDLRFNSGGLLREAIEVSDIFVPKHDLIVSTKGRLRSQNREYRAAVDPMADVPTFVLVNEASASASEIVAGALQDHHLGVIIGPAGKNTFGKGSVQTIESLAHSMHDDESGNPKPSAIRLTTAKYYTPSGRTIHHIGITPDVGVPLPKGHESDLLRHGLYGEANIPVPDAGSVEQDENGAEEPAEGDEPTAMMPILQNAPDEVEEEIEESDSRTEPFYATAQKIEALNDDFSDIMLDEAVKQMKIYMILSNSNPANRGLLAGSEPEAISLAE